MIRVERGVFWPAVYAAVLYLCGVVWLANAIVAAWF